MALMVCSACGGENRQGRRFCGQCGAALSLSCSTCGAANEPEARFCGSCGSALPAAPAASEAAVAGPALSPAEPEHKAARGTRERKIATVLFADLVGFTSLGEQNDPELVQALVSRAFERLSAEIERYEGLVEKFAGDAILAVFGVPAVHEDDAERAVRAALEMQSSMTELATELRTERRPELALRIGVESGEMLVDLERADRERDRIVTGDGVNTAARLQQAAQPGTVFVGPLAYAATRDVVEYEELPTVSLKGKALPVAAWRAVAVKARRGGRRAPLGIESPLIGRDEEMSLLKETVRRTVSEGRPHLVTVLGSAGVGKSRMAWELEKYLDGLPETYHWRKGRCLAYAQASYSALAEAIKSDAEIRDDDSVDVAADKLQARMAALGAEDDQVHQALRALLGLPAPERPRDELHEAWQRHLESIARRAPLVLVLEDIHWADEGLLDAIEYLARWSEVPVLILCLARHELLERRATWAGGIANASSIVLEPLGAEESARLVDGLLGGGLPLELRERVATFADGNPLFTEELVRMFVDRGVVRFSDGRWELARPLDEIEVPTSIQAVLAARLDGRRRPRRERRSVARPPSRTAGSLGIPGGSAGGSPLGAAGGDCLARRDRPDSRPSAAAGQAGLDVLARGAGRGSQAHPRARDRRGARVRSRGGRGLGTA